MKPLKQATPAQLLDWWVRSRTYHEMVELARSSHTYTIPPHADALMRHLVKGHPVVQSLLPSHRPATSADYERIRQRLRQAISDIT